MVVGSIHIEELEDQTRTSAESIICIIRVTYSDFLTEMCGPNRECNKGAVQLYCHIICLRRRHLQSSLLTLTLLTWVWFQNNLYTRICASKVFRHLVIDIVFRYINFTGLFAKI